MTVVYPRRIAQTVTLGQKVGGGGEGTVYKVENTILAAKVYSGPVPLDKLRIMIAQPPAGVPTVSRPPNGHIRLAWPVDLIADRGRNGPVTGFLMPLIDTEQALPLSHVYHPGTRRKVWPRCSRRDLFLTCANTATVVSSLHQTGRYVVGDLHEGNVLVFKDTKLVTFVDCDSMQVSDQGQTMLCMVGKPEFTAPELQGKPLHLIARSQAHDVFSLAVLIFMMLMQGVHPFDGTWTDGIETREARIARYAWPYDPYNSLGCKPRPNTLPIDSLPQKIQQLMRQCFKEGLRQPKLRPSAEEWQQGLLEAARTAN